MIIMIYRLDQRRGEFLRVYWKAPSMLVVSLEFGPEPPLSFTPPLPPLLKHAGVQPFVVLNGLQVTVSLKYGYSSSFITDSKAGTILDQKPNLLTTQKSFSIIFI